MAPATARDCRAAAPLCRAAHARDEGGGAAVPKGRPGAAASEGESAPIQLVKNINLRCSLGLNVTFRAQLRAVVFGERHSALLFA